MTSRSRIVGAARPYRPQRSDPLALEASYERPTRHRRLRTATRHRCGAACARATPHGSQSWMVSGASVTSLTEHSRTVRSSPGQRSLPRPSRDPYATNQPEGGTELTTIDPDRTGTTGRRGDGVAPRREIGRARRSTETKAAYKTTELIAYVAAVVAVLIAGLV